jgi:hypothetical protein
MASLTETAASARQVIKYSGFGFVAILFSWWAGIAAINYYKLLNPPPEAPPTVDFGKLPEVDFDVEKGRPNMELELPKGSIPAFTDRMVIFYAPTKRSGFLDPEKAIETAATLGFIFEAEQPTETRYVWRKQDDLNSTLDMNIISGHFKMTRAWQNNPALLALTNFGSDAKVINSAVNFMTRSDLLANDVLGNEKTSYLKAQADRLIPALSLSESEFVQIDFFRNPYKIIDEETKEVLAEYEFYRPDPKIGLVHMTVSGSSDIREQIIGINYSYVIVEYDNSGTYPIKTGQQAWDELKAGSGFVTASSPTSGTVKIRRMLLGYYDSSQPQKYAMPIYVFLGDNNFVAYISAVSNEWVGN